MMNAFYRGTIYFLLGGWASTIFNIYTIRKDINDLESHVNIEAHAIQYNVVTEQLDYQELLKRYKEEKFRLDVLTEKMK